jgi:hypothetical protein
MYLHQDDMCMCMSMHMYRANTAMNMYMASGHGHHSVTWMSDVSLCRPSSSVHGSTLISPCGQHSKARHSIAHTALLISWFTTDSTLAGCYSTSCQATPYACCINQWLAGQQQEGTPCPAETPSIAAVCLSTRLATFKLDNLPRPCSTKFVPDPPAHQPLQHPT